MLELPLKLYIDWFEFQTYSDIYLHEMYLTYKYRIKDSTSKKKLYKFASSVNYTWNYINNLSSRNIHEYRRFLSNFDINKYLADGVCKELNVPAATLQEIAKHYVISRTAYSKKSIKKRKGLRLKSRNRKNSLGWIPFKGCNVKVTEDTIKFQNTILRFWKDRAIPKDAKIVTGSFNQDARDRWYVNLVLEIPEKVSPNNFTEVGIDLGIKTQLILSDGKTYQRENLSKKYEDKLAKAQRAKKKKLVRTIYAKITNSRKDWNHKVTTEITNKYKNIYVGNIESTEILTENNKINRSIFDTSFYQIKLFLQYKAIRQGGKCNLVNEQYTTITCSSCNNRTGPSGEKDLIVREWTCSNCKSQHNRDINAAKNILRSGHATP